ncbi:eukaryotic translation initiation factor 4G [Folsomia candida]|uniref:eukaryotic translation initiation factor 4G n=1 Tax=Folsomia candida TaxID=158441 RepID=UPI000B8EF8F0|nr:eukaryotic translation initiation factor 4G [Folsomia candida]
MLGTRDDDVEKEAIAAKLDTILRNLTPTTLSETVEEFTKLPYESNYDTIVDAIIAKIGREPSYGEKCAKLIYFVHSGKTKASSKLLELILVRCQLQFHINVKRQLSRSEDLTEEKNSQAVRKMCLGNTIFIAELFNLDLLSEKVLANCVQVLLESNDDINLECLSILVTKAGQNYQAKAASSMDKILESIHSHSDNAAISAKSCKILKNVVKLGRNNWENRKTVRNMKANIITLKTEEVGTISDTCKPFTTPVSDALEGNTSPVLFNGKGGIDSLPPVYRILTNATDVQTTTNFTLTDLSTEILPSPQNNQIEEISTCQISRNFTEGEHCPTERDDKLRYLSMYANYDRMLAQLPYETVEDLNMDICIMIYEKLKAYKEHEISHSKPH